MGPAKKRKMSVSAEEEINILKQEQIKKAAILDLLTITTGISVSDKVLVDITLKGESSNDTIILGRPPVLGSAKKQMRHVTPYSFIEYLIKSKIKSYNSMSDDNPILRLTEPLKLFASDQKGLGLHKEQYEKLKVDLQKQGDFYHAKVLTSISGHTYYLIDDDKILEKVSVEIKQNMSFCETYNKNMGKLIDHSVKILQHAIRDENTLSIASEAIARFVLTLFNQRLYTAFPDEGNTLNYEIRYYEQKSQALDPKGKNFTIYTHDDMVNLCKSPAYLLNNKIRIVNNEGNIIKNTIKALEVIDSILQLCNINEKANIANKVNNYAKYDTQIKVHGDSLNLEQYNNQLSTSFLEDIHLYYHHIAKHLYKAFDLKPLEYKVFVPTQHSDAKNKVIVLPSADVLKTATYHLISGDDYREDQVNSARGYNKEVIFRNEISQEEFTPLLIRKILDHVHVSIMLFLSFTSIINGVENYPKAILKAFTRLVAYDYSEIADKQEFINNVLEKSSTIKVFNLSDADSVLLSSGEFAVVDYGDDDVNFLGNM
ncbi:MAG: hypothetical protein LF885_07380 (plasmid) [Rickettsia endosymbiont of Culicoides impunctatus]|nr:MAG: hypothetical protein LF885_07380 [Rickettsia endosymbiont of Culicoides impunctatus]